MLVKDVQTPDPALAMPPAINPVRLRLTDKRDQASNVSGIEDRKQIPRGQLELEQAYNLQKKPCRAIGATD
jgi:hypothetical protein